MRFMSNVFFFVFALLTISFGWLNEMGHLTQVALTAGWMVSLAGFTIFRLFGVVSNVLAKRARGKTTADAAPNRLRVVKASSAKRSPVNLAAYRLGRSSKTAYERTQVS